MTLAAKLALAVWTIITAGTAQAESDAKLSVRVYDHTGLPDKVLGASELLAYRIFRKAGIETEWIRCPKSRGEEDRFPRCQDGGSAEDIALQIVPASMEGYDVARSSFGFALPTGDGRPARFAYVYLRRVEQAAQQNGKVSLQTLLAHVMVHEIGHLLLGPGMHFHRGIMQSHWQPKQLQEMETGVLVFPAEQARTLRIRLAQRIGSGHNRSAR